MQLDTSTIMLGFFIILFIISVWKIYAFLPNKELPDDDTTPQAHKELERIMLQTIFEHKGKLTPTELFRAMKSAQEFDTKHFWRFNQNRVNKLLESYMLQHPHATDIQTIYEGLIKEKNGGM